VASPGAAAAALLGAVGETGTSAAGASIFDEEPVPLDVFVRDRAYLANPPLSEVQYEAVRHAERVYYLPTYEVLAGSSDPKIRAYWSQPCRMVNFLELEWGKGCKIAGMEFYDAVTGCWETVESAVEPGIIAAMRPGSVPEYAQRSAFFKAGSGRCLEVVTKSGYKTTVHRHHQFLTRGSGQTPFWRCLTQMRQGDWIATTRSLPEPLQPTVLDSREVEFVGLWLGDGNMPRLRTRGKYQFWTKLRMTIGHAAIVELARYEELCRSYGTALKIRDTNKLSVETRFGRNDPVTEIARKWGLFGKTFRDKRVPPEMMGLCRDQVALLLSRLIDTDGSVYFEKTGRPRIEFTSVSEGLVLDVRRLMLRLGARGTVRQRITRCQQPNCEGHTSWRLVVTDDQSLAALAAELTLLDKQERLDEVYGWVRHWQVERGVLRDPLYWDRIETIRDAGVHEFYDTEVTDSAPGPVWPSEAVQIEPESPGMHNYLSTGFLDHNGGKDHTCRMIAMRVCYLLLCLKSPQDYYAMPAQDSIHVLNVASSSKQAQRAFFAPMRRAIQRPGCWFQRAGVDILDAAERSRRGARGERTTTLLDTIRFEHNIEAVSGHSDADSQEGLNLILGIADEIDAFRSAAELAKSGGAKQRESSSSAEAILDMIRTSATTRFPEVFKNVHISYPRYLGSTIQQLIAKGRADNEVKGETSRYYVSGPLATWEANPRISGKEAFAEDYEKDPALAEAKYECRPRRAINPYFANEAAIRDCCTEYAQPPVSVGYVREGASWKPLYTFSPEMYPVKGALYAMHADLAATGDRAGVSMAHVKRWQDHALVGHDEEGLEIQVAERRPVVKVDFILSYESDAGQVPPMEIQIRWARMLCLELRRLGFPVVRFTFDQWQCVTGDTQIVTFPRSASLGRIEGMELLNGESVTIAEMARRYDAGETEQWVYSCTPDGHIVPGRCTKAWRTGLREDMVEVELDNGEKVEATSDHRFMLRDGTYRRAAELVPGDSLMPLYRRGEKIGNSKLEYEQVWHPGPGRWDYTHRMVSRALGFAVRGGEVIHHGFDGLKHRNNDPRNLRRMTKKAHSELHTRTPEWRAARAAERRAEKGLRTGRDHNAFRQDISFEDVRLAAEQVVADGKHLTRQAVAEVIGCSFTVDGPVCSRVREAGFSTWKEFKWSVQPRSYTALATAKTRAKQAANNHKVMAVRSAPPAEVYDLEVEEHHNFALSAGVFVHNSKDSMQILESHGIETDRFSTDVSEEGWRTLRDVMYEGRLEMPSRELTIVELLGLSRLPNGKIDHLGDSSKDEADALAGSVSGALEVGGSEDPAGNRAYPGQVQFYGPASEMLAPAGMPASMTQLGPDILLPPDRPGMEYGSSYLDDWGSASGGYSQ
jgi:intein/homing endonuclease